VCVHVCTQGKNHSEKIKGGKELNDADRAQLIDALDEMGWTLDKTSLKSKDRMLLSNGECPKEWKEFLSEAIEATCAHKFNIQLMIVQYRYGCTPHMFH
jgi:hypothetical protein